MFSSSYFIVIDTCLQCRDGKSSKQRYILILKLISFEHKNSNPKRKERKIFRHIFFYLVYCMFYR